MTDDNSRKGVPDLNIADSPSLFSRRELMGAGGFGLALTLAGCAALENMTDESTRDPDDHPGSLEVSDKRVLVGDTVELQGSDLPDNQELSLIWHSIEGRWKIREESQIVGPRYEPRTDHIATVTTDDRGEFIREWRIPEDYGGRRTFEIAMTDGTPLAKTSVNLGRSFEIDRHSAPIGETFTITTHGLGGSEFFLNYQMTWDNRKAGLITGISNYGRADVEVRAAGPPGMHHIQVHRGFQGTPFLNAAQSPLGPVAGGSQTSWIVEVTEPESTPETSWSTPLEPEAPITAHYPEVDAATETEISVTPTSGPTGTEVTISGSGFEQRSRVDLVWYSVTGNRVTGVPIEPVTDYDALPTVTTNSRGDFEIDVEIPADKGGTRAIVAEVGGDPVAVGGFVLQPSIQSIEPTAGPVGTSITIEIAGVGWTEYDNTYTVLWDNSYFGYGCGMDEEGGVVRYQLEAAGEPGYHFIDMYPALYDGEDEEPDLYGPTAMLSHESDHPRSLPTFHFAFEVTE